MQEFEEKAAAVHFKFPDFFDRSTKENCKRTTQRIRKYVELKSISEQQCTLRLKP